MSKNKEQENWKETPPTAPGFYWFFGWPPSVSPGLSKDTTLAARLCYVVVSVANSVTIYNFKGIKSYTAFPHASDFIQKNYPGLWLPVEHPNTDHLPDLADAMREKSNGETE